MCSIINLSIYNKQCSGGGDGGDGDDHGGDGVPQHYQLFPLFFTISKRWGDHIKVI